MLFVLLFVSGTTDTASRSMAAFWNLGHIALFMVLSYLLLTPPSPLAAHPFGRQSLILLCFTLVLGGLIEFVQGSIGRDMDLADMARNTIGSLLGLVCFAPSYRALARSARLALQALALCLLAASVSPLALAVWDEQRALKQWPVLVDFADAVQLSRWSTVGDTRLSIARPEAGATQQAMKVDFGTTKYAGASFDYFPGDWSGYQHLSIDIFNPAAAAVKISCRVHDRLHSRASTQLHEDRFNHSYLLQPGWNQLNISIKQLLAAPASRPMDIQAIDSLQLFVAGRQSTLTVYVGRLSLE
jgi:VanZ family protein